MRVYLIILSLLFCGVAFAQNSISGVVTDETNQPLPGVSVKVVGESTASITDVEGKFLLKPTKQPPYMVEISSVGYATQAIEVKTSGQKLEVQLLSQDINLDEIVVSASRTPERILESPVTIERMGIKDVKNTSSATFYDGLENLKEVHFNTSSLSFKSINTRGFATVANTRFMQLVDGMDNSSPALNFVLGNLIGLSELDVQSVELLPGASSALYGANAFNGILFMNSKSPFDYEGISVYARYGKTNQKLAGTNDYYDFGIRAAHKFSDYFAAKANFTYLKATEWIAGDERSMTNGGLGHGINQNYDGLNIYGDEVTTFIPNVGQVSRTGYYEEDINDNSIESVKADFSLHVKPMKDDFEIILQHKVGIGSTIYQGANRYRLEDFIMQQSKLEVKNRNFFVRAYMTTEDAGNSYDMRFAAWNVNRAWKTDQEWFTNYATAYQLSSAVMGASTTQAAGIARQYADYNQLPAALVGLPQFATQPTGGPRYMPGSPEFNNALATVIQNPDLTKGAKFIDQSQLYHVDGNYNFKEIIQFAEIQVGGSFRKYKLDSQGTIFTDFDGPIKYDEYGIYTQVQKKFMDDRLKFTGSIRYDKSQNFDGQYSPRISFVYSAGERKNHNFRVSFQTGFRNPTTQDQYIGLDLGPFALVGSAEDNLDRYVETMNVSAAGQALGAPATVTLSGRDAYNSNVYSVPSVQAFALSQNPADLEIVNIKLVKPEQVKAFEVGYKSVTDNGIAVDLNAYYNIYNDFMSTSRVIRPYYGTVGSDLSDQNVLLGLQALSNGDRRVYQVYTNTTENVTSFGFGVGLSKKIYKDFEFGINYNHAQFDFDQAKDPSFIAGFNTPRHRVKASLGNQNLFKNFGFNLNARWSDEYLWQSSFADGMIPAVTVFDAQMNYAVPSMKSVFKISASNLFGNDYLQVIGAGRIGQQYLVSWIINP
ncbi:carboxypeptidase-like regulatory domain-containing protein [Flavobacterium lindanitolerans]|jgi:outer membrane receptor protein involved in Fe transport|uniref:carboxypeptidase-like regulatory domain-containing protein n=2 Tax=Flavobacterium lindanitolerans TaxID=428988 RepID=UPI0023F070C8|nr:carboxypeptidase-like regulatory domain-containing protein [Flavobacterium lindanitolerans]